MNGTLPLLAALLGSSAWGAELPFNFDELHAAKVSKPVPGRLSEPTRGLVGAGHIAHVEARLGVPTFFWAGLRAVKGPDLRAAGLSPEQAARGHLFTYAELYGTSPPELAESERVAVHDTGEGAVVAAFSRRVAGVPVFRDEIKVVMSPQLALLGITGYLSPHRFEPTHAASRFNLTATTAVEAAFVDATGSALRAPLLPAGVDTAGFALFRAGAAAEPPAAVGPMRVRKVFYSSFDRLEAAYHLELGWSTTQSPDAHAFAYVVSAADGRVLYRKNLTEEDKFTYRVWAEATGLPLPLDGPQGSDGTPHPTGSPNGYQPAFVAPVLVTLESGPLRTQDPWLPPLAQETQGNNAEAYADLASPDGYQPDAGDLRATTTAPNTFDRAYNPQVAPSVDATQRMAAVTQLFFNVNFLHDWYYDKGFDEQWRNAQASNYGRGGADGDALKVEAQDYGGRNNANMSTPADGARPRMQQYVFDGRAARKLTISSPAPVAGEHTIGIASGFGPTSYQVSQDLALALDALLPDGGIPVAGQETSFACPLADGGLPAFTNAVQVAGRLALVDRGSCNFPSKALVAQANGAIGVLIANNVDGGSAVGLGGTSSSVNIPAAGIATALGAQLKAALASSTVNVTLLREPVVDRDGTIDNAIVAHEWGHYISNRLIGNSAGLTTQQARGMGEGWGDFTALLMVVREADAALASNTGFGGAYAVAGYTMGGKTALGAGNDGFYYGIRRVPYSADFAKNALTFHHIEDGVALPTTHPFSGGSSANSEVHNTGEVWATMLWECYAALLRASSRMSFTQAQERMLGYLVASYKITPNAPTFLEARDALLIAALARDPADFSAFWQAFARRGAGLRAEAPDRASATNSPVVEDFNVGTDVHFVRATLSDELRTCDQDGFLDNTETGTLAITLKNVGAAELRNLTGTITSATPGVTIAAGGSVVFPSAMPFTTTTVRAPVTLNGATGQLTLSFSITVSDPQLAPGGTTTWAMSFRGNLDDSPQSSAQDGVEGLSAPWTSDADPALSVAERWTPKELAVTDHLWAGPGPRRTADIRLVSPALTASATGAFSFSFRHRFQFEADATSFFDGAVIEYSIDAGATWADVESLGSAGYTGTLVATGANPLRGRRAFVGSSASYPSFVTSTVNLGTSLQGRTVLLRFRIGSDAAVGSAGWEIDDLDFRGAISNTPFSTPIADPGTCPNRPPVAGVGPDQAVPEGSWVLLDASPSTDPDNDPLVTYWTQVLGPTVPLAGSKFLAPEVSEDTDFAFELEVSDGRLISANRAVALVKVLQVNKPPLAKPGAGQSVDERTVVTLSGSGTDPDGDALTFSWTQTGGPTAVLSDPHSASCTFTAPEVTSETPLVFSLVVSDGSLSSVPSPVEVRVRNVNRAPQVSFTPWTIDERALARLPDGASDPDGDTLQYTWRQVAGPPVALSSTTERTPELTAPEVSVDTALAFELTVTDGVLGAGPSRLDVLVRQVNRPPQAFLELPVEVAPGATVEMTAGGTFDPDGDPLELTWAQTDGPTVSLEGGPTAVTFTAPTVSSRTRLEFQLTARDAHGAQAIAVEGIHVEAHSRPGCGCQLTNPTLALAALAVLRWRVRRYGPRRRGSSPAPRPPP